jgi:hypothetical protein
MHVGWKPDPWVFTVWVCQYSHTLNPNLNTGARQLLYPLPRDCDVLDRKVRLV